MTFRRESRAESKVGWQGASKGGFRADGSWDFEGRPDTPLMNLVKELQRMRHTSHVTPSELVRAIPTPLMPAFPNLEDWSEAQKWCCLKCSTSAESAVKYAFQGHDNPRVSEPENPTLAIGL